MYDNVIILGAGASADANIPMLGGFMDTMWTLARTGRFCGRPLKASDLSVLTEALKIREYLDNHHGRVNLDVWNIEDVLSVLSFASRQKLDWMTKAIARVLEITCAVVHNGKLD